MSDAPRWFTDALAHRPDHRDVTVDGARIHLRVWGDVDRPGVVLVHGGGAHSGWWDHVAPLLAAGHRVVAVDLSGHGDSDHRSHYSLPLWAREVLVAATAGGITGRPVLVGHSMGGWVAAMAGVSHGAELDGVVVLDTPLLVTPPEGGRLRRPARVAAPHPDREALLARFAATPAQEVELPYVRDHVAEQSVRQVDGGWRWKFDVGFFPEMVPLGDLLPDIGCRVHFVRSEFGLIDPAMAARIEDLLGHPDRIVDLPAAGHHPMLDQPLALVTTLRALLARWAPASA